MRIELENEENKFYYDLSCVIKSRGDDGDTRLLNLYLDQNPNLDVIFVENGKEHTPITLAISFENENAARILCARMKDQGILKHHLSREVFDVSPLHLAALRGDPTVVKILLANGADPNAFSGKNGDARNETPLMSAVHQISPYSLIQHGNWGNKELQEQLQQWYTGELIPGTYKKVGYPSAAVEVNWSGNKKVVQELLKYKGVDPNAEDMNGISPYKLLTTLTDPGHIERNTFHDGVSHPKVLSVTDDLIVFEAQIINRRGDKHTITVNYYVRELRQMLADKIEQNKKEGFAQSPEAKAEAERKRASDSYSKIPALKQCFKKLSTDLTHEIDTVRDLLTNKVVREHYAIADKAADGISAVSGHVPVVGVLGKVASKGVQHLSNKNELGKHKQLDKNAPKAKEVPDFCEDIAIGVIEKYKALIEKLSDKRTEKFAKKVVETAYELLTSKNFQGEPKEVVDLIVNEIVADKEVAETLTKLATEQTNENAKLAQAAAKEQSKEKAKYEAQASKERAKKAAMDAESAKKAKGATTLPLQKLQAATVTSSTTVTTSISSKFVSFGTNGVAPRKALSAV